MRTRHVLLFCLISIASYCVKAQKLQCTTPNGYRGQCVSIYDCKPILAILQGEESDEDEFEFLKASVCDVESNGRVIVCCGSQRSFEDILPTGSSCGYQDIYKIIGNAPQVTEFPWLVLLEQTKTSGDKIFECGGVLISPQYVLTAAHCVVNTTSKVTSARLGEWNLDTLEDCVDEGGYKTCFPPPEDIRIEEIIIHDEYYRDGAGAVHNDIALIRLVKPATLNEFVRPICLPSSSEKSKAGRRVYIAGWGVRASKRYSPTKQKLRVPVEEQSVCSSKYKQLRVNITTKQICAGGEEGKDSCIGDSGGPLMATTKNDASQYYVEGIASYGRPCGTKDWPEVYTRVTEYLDWIKQNVKS